MTRDEQSWFTTVTEACDEIVEATARARELGQQVGCLAADALRWQRERDEARRAAEWWRDQQREIDIYESPDDYRLPWEEGDRDE